MQEKKRKKDKDTPLTELEIQLLKENDELKTRLLEAEDALNAIRNGEVDAIVVSGTGGEKIFSLSSAETPYRILIEEMPEGAMTLNSQGRILYCNRRFSEMTGLPSSQIIGCEVSFFIDENNLKKFEKLLKAGKKGRSSGDFSLITATKKKEYCLFTVSPLPEDSEGDLCLIISNITEIKKFEHHLSHVVDERNLELEDINHKLVDDIEKRIEVERKLKESEETMQHFLDHVPIGIIRWSADGPITFANDYFLRMIGYTREDLEEGRIDWAKMTLPEFGERDKIAFEEFYSTGTVFPYEKAYYRKDGSILPIMISSVQVQAARREGISFIIDLSEIKRKEQMLRQGETIFIEAQKLAKMGSWEFDIQAKKIKWSENFYLIYGFDPQLEPSLELLYSKVHPDDLDDLKEKISQALTEFEPYTSDYRILLDGKIKYIHSVARIYRDNDNSPEIIIGISQDVTARVLREEQLKESEANVTALYNELQQSEKKYRELVKYAPTAIYEIDFKTRKFTSVNESMVILTGYSREELLSMDPSHIMDEESRNLFAGRIRAALSGEMPEDTVEYRIRTNNGRYIDALLNIQFRYEGGLITSALVVGQDITHRKEIERALQSAMEETEFARSKLLALLSASSAAIVIIDAPDGKVTFRNEMAIRMYGTDPAELTMPDHPKLGILQLNGIPYKATQLPASRTLLTGEVINGEEIILARPDGTQVIASVNTAPLFDKDGNVESVIIVFDDITEKKNYETELLQARTRAEEQKNRLETFFRISPLGIVIFEGDQKSFGFVNEAARSIFGYSSGKIMGENPEINILFPDEHPVAPEEMPSYRSLINGETINGEEYIIERADGSRVNISVFTAPFCNMEGKIEAAIGIMQDITASKQDKKKLEYQSFLLNNISDAIIASDSNLRITYWNKGAENMYGWSAEEAIGQSGPDFLGTRFLNADRESSIGIAIETGSNEAEVVQRNKKGEEIHFQSVFSVLTDNNGNITDYIAVNRDLTEKNKIDQELRESEERFVRIFRNNPVGISISDVKEHRFVDVNNSFLSIFGYHRNEIIGKKPEELNLLSAEDLDKLLRSIQQHGRVNNYELQTRNRDGIGITLLVSAEPINLNGEEHILFASRDITERKKAEDEIRRSRAELKEALDIVTEREREKALLANIIEVSTTAIAFSSLDGEILFANREFENLTGYTPEELKGKNWNKELTAPEYRELEVSLRDDLLKTGIPKRYEKEYVRKDGTYVPVEVLLNTKKDQDGTPQFFFAFLTDITDRKRNEEKLHRLIRTLRAMQKSSQLMIHARDEKQFLEDVCKIIVEDCGHELVWIGYKQHDEKKSIIPVAYYGFDESYIRQLDLTWDDSERGRGPSGTAMRTGTVALCRDMQTDPSFSPWREEAIKRGFRSSIVLPLYFQGEVSGILTIYSRDFDPFTGEEQQLLMKLADDLSYGIAGIRVNMELKRAKEDLEIKVEERTSLLQKTLKDLGLERKRFMDVLNMIPAYVVLITREMKIAFSNRIFNDKFGEWTGNEISDGIFREAGKEIGKVFITGTPLHREWTGPDDRIYQVSDFPYTDNDGTRLVLEMGVDITDKKNVEKYVLSKILETEEKDRRRFASDLHDDLGPTLSAIKLQLSLLGSEDEKESRTELLSICDLLLSEGIEKMRNLANNIMPSLIESYGLETAVKSFIHRMEKSAQLTFNLNSNMNGFRFDNETELHLYRVVTELINNTIKHSGATEVKVELLLSENNLKITYCDNGIGYSTDHSPLHSTGIGLQNIRNRINLIKGSIDFQTKNGKTQVIIHKAL